jgi:hypothetical protein
MTAPADTVTFIDAAEEAGRSTATLLASLSARLATLHYVTGAAAVGSLVAGFAALGRAVSESADGVRLREALLASRAASNGDALWSALKIGDWTAGLPPSPLLEQLQNDLALLLSSDLDQVLPLLPIPAPEGGAPAAAAAVASPRPTAIDCVLGLWAFGRQTAAAVEAIAAPLLAARERVQPAALAPPAPAPVGPLLR